MRVTSVLLITSNPSKLHPQPNLSTNSLPPLYLQEIEAGTALAAELLSANTYVSRSYSPEDMAGNNIMM
eukprot:scaffold8146_cov157-Skeletonema_menzelii.AAC.5